MSTDIVKFTFPGGIPPAKFSVPDLRCCVATTSATCLIHDALVYVAPSVDQQLVFSSDGSSVEFRRQFAILSEQRREELLDLVKNVADAVMAINWLPAGILWGGKLSPAKNAVFGTLSSVIGLYTLVQEEKNTQSWEKQH